MKKKIQNNDNISHQLIFQHMEKKIQKHLNQA